MTTDLAALFGQARMKKLRRFARQTDRSMVGVLEFGLDLVERVLAVMPQPQKVREAVTFSQARWANVSVEERTAHGKRLAKARWGGEKKAGKKGQP